MWQDQFTLEKKGRNTRLKENFIQSIYEKSKIQWDKSWTKQKRLENALNLALDWQNKVENETISVNGHTYVGPHKWIVCIIGSDAYTVEDFRSAHEQDITDEKKHPNTNISILGLSSEPFEMDHHGQHYFNLTQLT